MHAENDWMSLKSQMASKIANAWQFDTDTENLFPNRPLLEEMADNASGAVDGQPRKILRDRQYGPQPLIVMPEYKGDFLNRLRDQYVNKCADSLLDFSAPDDLLKYLPDPQPRDLQDDFYEIGRPGDGAGYDTLKQYHDRGWDENDSPEMSEDKILRMNDWGNKKICPCLKGDKPSIFHSANNVITAFLSETNSFRAKTVVANFLMNLFPNDLELDLQRVRIAKMLSDFQRSLIYTKANGWRKPGEHAPGVPVRLLRAEPRAARWTFSTGSHSYATVFQFIPKGTITDPNKLHVRVSCSCPSWLFWGAQYNAVLDDYLYGKVKPKFTPPNKRDPSGRFLVCKHVLACIPIVSRYKIAPASAELKTRLRKPPKVEVDLTGPKEPLRIPIELKPFGRQPEIKDAVQNWDTMPEKTREEFIEGLDAPGAVAFMAHRFPETATKFVIPKLKNMAVENRVPSLRVQARKFLRGIV